MLDRTDPTTEALLRAVAGHYRLEREIGRGGMGIVFLGTDEQLERSVAIKTLPPHLSADAQVRGRFLREARTAARLSHPNIVPVYFSGERDGVVFFAMAYVDGMSMAERIANSGPMSVRDLTPLLIELSSALGYAHENGVVHRDIKAENVLIDSRSGRAMLTDFGIARVAETQPNTATGTVLGTVQYMSPEQVSGETLDGRSDLYALGVLAYLALSGRFPFERPTASAILVAHVTTMPPALCTVAQSVPPTVGAVIDRLLAKSPNDRYPDANAFRDALYRALEEPPVRHIPGSASAPPSPSNALALNQGGVMSSTEANQVWSRAAELQANTGMIVPPAEFTARKPDTSLTSGFDQSLVKASAVDAGIDARYVDRALAEREQSMAAASIVRTGESMSRQRNLFAGGHTKIALEAAFDGELDSEAFEDIADQVQRSLGEMVTVSSVGRTLTITSVGGGNRRGGNMRELQINIASRNGRTNIRAFENLTNLAAVSFGPGIGAGAMIGAVAVGNIMPATHNGFLAAGAMAASILTAMGVARLIFMRKSKKREAELRDLVERIVVRARLKAR